MMMGMETMAATETSEIAQTGVKRSHLDADAADRLRAVIGKLSRRLRPTVAGSALTPSEISVLFTVVRRGPLGLSELAEIEAMNPTMVSRVTLQLVELGLIRREARPDDRRAATVSATAAGRRMRERVHVERSRALGEYVGGLEVSQQEALLAALPALEELAERIGEVRR
jgi:DNA-binding MarR family transcriptional regulator